jgi:uncharacterized Zn finger protein
MEALDGNAIAGPLSQHFGAEMTTARGTCSHCGAATVVAELRVFTRAPGTVARCPGCGGVLIVLIDAPDSLRVDVSAFRL